MKTLKVTVRRGVKGEHQRMYPARYDPEEVDREGMGVLGYSQSIEIGEPSGFCLIALDDARADEYALDPDMEIIPVADADALLDAWATEKGLSTVKRDPEVLAEITARNTIAMAEKQGVVVSQADKDALDPSKPAAGVTGRKKLADIPALKSKVVAK